jgi:GAF domain-containing protein
MEERDIELSIDSKLTATIWNEIDVLIDREGERDAVLQGVNAILAERVDHYSWVGFYLTNHTGKELELGPFVGAHTDHTLIAYGQGICGQVAEAKRTFVIQDVNNQNNYLACSLDVKSEIVVPILKDGEFVGELDIDSHELAPFTDEDTRLLEGICKRLEKLF